MATFTEDGEKFVLNKVFKSAGHELCLASDADLTEITDSNYARVELPSVLTEPQDGFVANGNIIVFNVGEQTASWWFVVDASGDKLVFGALPSPQFGEFQFPVGAIRFEAISGG
jgi:hypothetical protein